MASLQAQNVLPVVTASSPHRPRFHASLPVPINPIKKNISLSKLPALISVEEFIVREEDTINNFTQPQTSTSNKDEALISKLYVIAEAVADRAEMHTIIGLQRNDWNKLLLNSINSITLSVTLMAGISSIPIGQTTPFSVSSTIHFAAATGMMLLINKIQPSQLAEDQRKATQLYKQLERSINTTIALGAPTELCCLIDML